MRTEKQVLVEDFCKRHALQILHMSKAGDVFSCCSPFILLHACEDRGGWLIWLAHPARPLSWFWYSKVFDFLEISPRVNVRPEQGYRDEVTQILSEQLQLFDSNWDRVLEALDEKWVRLQWPDLFADGGRGPRLPPSET